GVAGRRPARLREASRGARLREAAPEPDGSAPAGIARRAEGPAAEEELSPPCCPSRGNRQSAIGNRQSAIGSREWGMVGKGDGRPIPHSRLPIPTARVLEPGLAAALCAALPAARSRRERPLPGVALRATLPAGRQRRPLPGYSIFPAIHTRLCATCVRQ